MSLKTLPITNRVIFVTMVPKELRQTPAGDAGKPQAQETLTINNLISVFANERILSL
jgi:hypothetical protein